jgi:hypothetical protein
MLKLAMATIDETFDYILVHGSPLKLAELLTLRPRYPSQNVLAAADVAALIQLADFDPVKSEQRVLMPGDVWPRPRC